MKKKKQGQKTSGRKPYSKPDLHRVELNPEESLAGACKLNDAPASSVSQCNLDLCIFSGS